MKKLYFAVVIALLFFTQNVLAAGDKAGSFNISALIGLSKPAQPSMFSDNFDLGYNVSGQFGYTFNSNATILPLVLDYQSSSLKDDITGGLFEGNLSTLSITPTFMLSVNNEENVNPFLLFGIGLYHLSYKQKMLGDKESITENNFGLNLGGGLEFSVSETTSIITTVKYHYVLTEDEKTGFIVWNVGLNLYLLGY